MLTIKERKMVVRYSVYSVSIIKRLIKDVLLSEVASHMIRSYRNKLVSDKGQRQRGGCDYQTLKEDALDYFLKPKNFLPCRRNDTEKICFMKRCYHYYIDCPISNINNLNKEI